MKHISAGIKIGVLVLVFFVVGYVAWKTVGGTVGADGYHLFARFRDAQGLASKSRVVIAGLPVGEITSRRLEGRLARITVRVKKDTEIWSNAGIYKKSSSLLGEYYLEIDPGTPESTTPHGEVVQNHLLKEGDEIVNVFEASSTDDLIRSVNETIPKVNETVEEIRGLASDVRKLVNGPIANMAENLDEEIDQDAALVHSILTRADRALANIDRISEDVAKVTRGSDKQIDRILDNIEQASEEAKSLLKNANTEVTQTGQSIRDKLDKIDTSLTSFQETLHNTSEITRKINEDEGTLGKFVNDPTIGENIESITTDVAGFVKTAFGLQTYVGIRTEYNFSSSLFKTYFSLELQPRADKYYLVEIVDDPRGSPTEKLVFDNNNPGSFMRATVIETPLRFTFQFAKILGPFTVRIGIKESSGGVGGDLKLPYNGRLTMDIYDTSFDRLPRLKVWAAYQFFTYLYVYGGVDDVLNDHESIPINGYTISGDVQEYHFGRDFFVGAGLRFNDVDLAALLFIGGSALAGAAN